ncbi:sugar kinase [Brevibacillus sp. SYP-B805]|uniref:sugar kinase n=1 Tax=Brevibacillus sp. SYP-B805 TaxID=1578199 RepID=UPI0013EDBDE2|nr:sugar kinase [Brevibacillus sp. SYP-B805]NGQ96695.1 sugar kinase [Brevibacillus sp. SYP-B805]
MAEIITIGEILVEVMAKSLGQTFEQTGEFIGPFPSGAPAIFIDQATKTGSSTAIVSKVGRDGFGRLNVERLKRDGVDVRYIGTVADKTTGIAFVTYKENGDRDFIFTLKDSAAACVTPEDVREEMFEGCNYFHIMGCSAFNAGMIAALTKAISIAKDKQVKITFDPNIRKELMENERVKAFILYALRSCDIFLPGEEELKIITGLADEREAAEAVFAQQVRCMIVKRGSRGCTVYERDAVYDVEPYPTEEVDPTGAGDCFAGTFVSLINQGRSIREAVTYANAAGAYAVSRKGPMEGTATLAQLEAFLQERRERG